MAKKVKGPPESFTLEARFACAPEELLQRWLHPVGHSSFTGGAEAVMAERVGEMYSTWDGYIEGTLLSVEPLRVVQSWRTNDFGGFDPDSTLELLAEAIPGGMRLTLVQTNLPAGSGETYRQGWEEHYFRYMRELLGVPD